MKIFRKIYYNIKYFIQRGKKGYSNFDLMDMDNYLLELIPNMLKDFKNRKDGFPMHLNENEWNNILDEIISCFEKANPSTTDFVNPYKEDYYQNIVDPWYKKNFKPQIELVEENKQSYIKVLDMTIPEENQKIKKLYDLKEEEKETYIQNNLENGFKLLVKYFNNLWY